MIKYSLFILIFHICTKISNPKKKRITSQTCVFECFQSHCHILKKLHEFLHMMGAITIFGQNNLIFNILDYGLLIKSLGAWVHIHGGEKENKLLRLECEIFTTKLGWIISSSF